MKEFNELTYKGQVRRLRAMALEALKEFPVKVEKLKFIFHGENTTFQVITKNKKYLLRLHRPSYHTASAIQEELRWLANLNKTTDLKLQNPVKTKKNKLYTIIKTDNVPDSRICDLMSWVDGRIKGDEYLEEDLVKMGELAAKLHNQSEGKIVKYRRYWDLEGLLGKNATFGSLMTLKSFVSSSQYLSLRKSIERVQNKIRKYEKMSPKALGLIHADLHFHNVVWSKKEVTPIDFDDCGYGFHMYDLAVIVSSAANKYKKATKKQKDHIISKVVEGYAQFRKLSTEDIKSIHLFLIARKLTMLAWMYERRDNPNLLKYFKKNYSKIIQNISKDSLAL